MLRVDERRHYLWLYWSWCMDYYAQFQVDFHDFNELRLLAL